MAECPASLRPWEETASPCVVVIQGHSSRGRVTVATRPLAPGEIILAERAVACVAHAGRSLCDDCLNHVAGDNNRVDRIGDRQCVDCQSLFDRCSSSGHASRGLSSHSQAPSVVRLAAKILLRRYSGSLGHEQASRIDNLMHRPDEQQQQQFDARTEDFSSGSSRYNNQDEEDCAQVAKLVSMDCVAAGATEPEKVPRGALLDLARKELRRVSLNAITTCDGSGATGLGLFPSAAMFNHACCPNCQAWWKGSKLEIRSTKPVAAGEELCFSYIPIDQPSALRRAQLRHNWFFTCYCTRCVSGQWDAELTGLKCPAASCAGAVRAHADDGGGASCNQCDLFRAVDGRSTDEAGKGPPQDSTTVVNSCCGNETTKRRSPVESTPEEHAILNRRRREESLREARRNFEGGMEAYMREDPEVALVALEKSLLVCERILHPFNKELLRTLRYASYAAVATHSWVKAHSFLSRWLHPMETMFGAAEVWDIAAMRIDAGLVLDKLHAGTTVPETAPSSPSPVAGGGPSRIAPSAQSDVTNRHRMHPAAYCELAEGLRWIWICLGRDSGLSAETAALEVCSDHGIHFKLGSDAT